MTLARKSFDSEEITLAREAASPIRTRSANIEICLITMPNAIQMRFKKLCSRRIGYKLWFPVPDFTFVMVLECRIYNFYFGFAFSAGISIDLSGADMPGLNTLIRS